MPATSPSSKHYPDQGLTLLEVLLSITLLVIIASIAVPSVSYQLQRRESDQVQQTLSKLLQLAKLEALSRQQNIVLCASTDLQNCQAQAWHNGLLLFVDYNHNQQRDTDEPILQHNKQQLRHGSLQWLGNASHINSIVFQGDNALPRGSMGRFRYCNSQYNSLSHDLILSAMGHQRPILRPNCSSS
ncbi:hypothetical protein BFG52_03415 [Acinetobacter larvae]|uniref:Type II secretion system protein H n=2 Tax=Acinetobacter larvae TaxID=1789224 RepID=A0A1B2LX27_9GAMM|nr:hypothetical protein BFG52_03415 [Acinetobacter larvae]